MEIQAATGEWMNEYVRRPSRRRDNRVYVPPADVVKRSIRRSWTISNPSSRWSATRGSPELRAYNSLPRHQECCYTSLNHSPRDKSPPYPRDESGPCGSPRSRDSPQPSAAHKFSLPDDRHPTERPSTSSLPPSDVDKCPAATTTSEPAEQGPPAGAFRDRMSTSPALSARVRRQQYFSSRSDDDTEFQSRYLQNHVLRQHRQKSEEDKSSSPGSSPSVQESRLAAARDLRDVTSSSTSHSSREVSPLTRRHQSFDVVDRPHSRTISLLQNRHSSVDRGEAAPSPTSPHRRYFVLGQDVPSSRHSLLERQSSVLSSSPHRRPLLHRDYVSSTLEYSGNSDSGGEVVATPPPHSRRYGAARDDTSSLSSHKADGSPVHASSGDDFDVEPISGTVFRKVTVKKRRQETRRVLDNGRLSRRSSSRVVESVRVTEVSSDYYHSHHEHRRHHQHRYEPLPLSPDVDDYRLVFISSDSSSSKEDDDEDEDDGADEDTESSSSAGCDWDYFEQGCCGERAVEEVTLCDQHCPAPPEASSGGSGGASAAAAWRAPATASPRCAACGSATVLPVPVPIPVPVPFPVPFWSPAAHQHPFMQDAALGVSSADVVAAASGGGGVRIRIRNPPAPSAPPAGPSRVVLGPWSYSWPADLISPLISGSTIVAVTSTGAVVQCPPAVVDASSRALAAVPACEIFIRHERAEEPPAAVAEIAAPADLPRRDIVSLSAGDKPRAGADSTDDAVRTVACEPVTVEPVDKEVIASESVVHAGEEQARTGTGERDNNKEAPATDAGCDNAAPEPSGENSSAQEKGATSTDPEPSSQDSPAQEGSDPDTSAPATNTVRFDLSEKDDEPDEVPDDTLERQRRALLSLPRERLHSSSSTSSSSSSTSSGGCQDSEDEGAVTTQVAAGCYTVTAGGDSDADSDASEATSTSSGGEFSKVFVINDGEESDDEERDGLPEAPAEVSSAGSDAEDDEGGAVVLLKHASFNSDDKTEEASGRESSVRQNKEDTVVCTGKKSNAPSVLSELACAAEEHNTEKCEDGIVLLKHVKKLEPETATVDASLHSDRKGEEEKQESEADGIVLVKHVKKLEEDSADVSEQPSDLNSVPDGVLSDKDAKEEEGVEDGSESEDSASDEVQMHHDTGDSSDSDSDSSTFSTSGCDSDLDSGDGGVVLLRHVEVIPEGEQKVVNGEQFASVARDDVDKECGAVIPESVSEADTSPVVQGEAGGETENSDEVGDRGDEGAKAEEAESSDSDVEGECTVIEIKEETGGENNDVVLDGRDDLAVSEGEASDSAVAQVAEQGAVVVTPVEEEVPAAPAVSSSSGEGPHQPEVTTEQKPAGHGEDGGDSTATQDDDLPVQCEVSEEEVAAKESDAREECLQEVVECVEETAESIVNETDEVHSVEAVAVQELEATGSVAEESALREGIRDADEDKAASAPTTGGGEALRDSWSGGVVLRRIRHLDDEGSDPALAGGRERNYDGRAAASSSPPGSQMAPAAAAERGAPRAAAAHDTEEGVRNTCISLAALFAECDSASPAVREDEVSKSAVRSEVALEVDERVATTGAGTSGASAAVEAPVDGDARVGGESAAEMTSGDSAPAEHALDRERGREDVVGKTAVKEERVSHGEDSVTGGEKVEEHASANLEPPEIEQPVEPDIAAHLLSPEQSDVSRRSRSASESEGTVKLEEETESGEEESAEEERRSEGARAAAPAPGAPSTAAAAASSVGRESPTRADAGQHGGAPPERYTSLVMITQDAPQQSVSVVTSETTTLVPAGAAPSAGGGGDVVVRHTNWEEQAAASGLAGYFTLTLEAGARSASPSARRPLVTKTLAEPAPAPEEDGPPRQQEDDVVHVVTGADTLSAVVCLEEGLADDDSWVEEVGDRDEDEFATTTASEGEDGDDSSCDESGAMRPASYSDREEELRGYHRSAIDFTLHTIVEESCEESEVEHASRNGAGSGRKSRPTSASELEKYFFFRLGNGAPANPGGSGAAGGRELDSMSDTCSSIYSEGLESLGGGEDGGGGAGSPRDDADADELAALASSRLEKYFLTGFMGFMGPTGEGAGDSDGSGSVGSDSEGRPSPEQRRKRLVTRARRGHQLSVQQMASPSQQQQHDVTPELSCSEAPPFSATEDSSSTETEGLSGSLGAHDETITTFDRPDGQFDTVKRKKKRRSSGCPSPAVEEPPQTSISTPPSASLDAITPTAATTTGARESSEDEDGAKTPQPEFLLLPSDLSASRNKQHSRDSGFIGSCDDLLKEQRTSSDSSSAGGSDAPVQPTTETATTDTAATSQKEEPSSLQATPSADDSAQKARAGAAAAPASSDEKASQPVPPPPATSLTRKDSFNNWSSDEETNLMMSKMRAFFKTMVAAAGANSSGRVSGATSTSTPQASPGVRPRSKPPQLVYFENELTRLMKTVPGIRDDQVREIVEYLSSEDTWSDSYDSSDYTSSDLEAQHEHHHRHQFHQYHPYAYQPVAPPGSPSTRSDIQEQISASCRQIINKFDTAGPGDDGLSAAPERDRAPSAADDKDNALVYQKLVASFSKMASNEAASAAAPGGGSVAAGFGGPAGAGGGVAGVPGGGGGSASSTPHSSPPLFAKVMQHIGSRLVALMHEVSGGEGVATSSPKPRLHHHGHHHHHHHHHHHRRLQQKPSSASTTTEEEEEDSSHTDTEQSPAGVSAPLLQLPRSKSHDLLLEQQQHEARLRSASSGGHVSDVERSEHSDYERFSWRGSFESALMAADSRTKLSLLAGAGSGCGSGGVGVGVCGALPESCKRRSAGDLLLASAREHAANSVDRVRSCGSIGGLDQEQVGWRRRSSVPDAGRSDNTSADDEDDDDDDDDVGADEGGEERARSTTLPRSLAPPGAGSAPPTSNSLPRLPPSLAGMHKAHSVHHLLQAAAGAGHVKSARYRPPGFVSRPASTSASAGPPPKRAVSAPGLHQPQPAPRANAPARRRPQPPTSLLPSGEDLAAGEEAASTSASLQRPLSKSATPSPVVGGAASRKNSTSLSVAGDFAAAAADADDNKLRPGLSTLGARSDSLASVYSGAGEGRYGTVAVRGEVEFGLQYNYKAGALEILVKQCRDLAPVDTKRNRSDPYVKVYLLPDKSKSGKRKTKVKKHTLNPLFDETLKFHITLHGLETRTLWLTVWHSDMFGRNDFLGEVMMSLENKVFDDPTPQWYPLQERTEPFDDLLSYKGDIIIGLKFVPPDVTVQKKGKRSRGSLQVLVKEAKNLTAVKANGTSDPFCKSYLLPDKGRSSKQKTPVLRRTCNPVWNYTFAYEDVSLQELSERSLELTVWDHDRLASNEFLGGLRFNLGTGKHYGKSVDWMDATGKEMTLWQSMLERPNFWVEGCLTLRPSLEHRSTNS